MIAITHVNKCLNKYYQISSTPSEEIKQPPCKDKCSGTK